ncbi:UDP-N-acetylmuramate dehydrogenase [Inquilinus sp. CAU 1745]|uniref:UDP-N-acetylmuramate dehydrogenase n=1 Tax=Inquilinus sp. CAU 1745 TaxID=3140369 RepID=UPI00325B75B5
MMPAVSPLPRLIDRLPAVRGRLTENAPLSQVTWFRVGGPADVLFKPADRDDLAAFLAGCPEDVPITVIGVASNLLVRDGGVRGIVIRLGRDFAGIEAAGDTIVAGAAALDVNVARVAQEAGLSGIEFLVGIPGTIGGALRMNAGAYGREVKDALREATALDRQGNLHTLPLAELGLAYRHSDVPADWIFTGAVFETAPGDRNAIAARMKEITDARGSTQPIRSRTGGSTFANPDGHKAWQLIDAAGCRGLRIGGAQVSEQHCNFLLNTGDATATDIEGLGEEVRRRVRDASGIELRWEIRRIGEAAHG